MKSSQLSLPLLAVLVTGLLVGCASHGGVPDGANGSPATSSLSANSGFGPAPSIKDLEHMVKARVADELIIQQIHDSHAVYELDASAILGLEDAGFSDHLIACMIDTATNLVVDQTPPALLVESQVAAPGQDFMWIPGEWLRPGGGWQWDEGGWILTPAPNAVWVPTRWEYGTNGWRCVPGRWHMPESRN